MSEVKFIRVNGRIVPIKKKKDANNKKAAAKGAASAVVLAGSAKASSDMVKKSRPNFVKSAQLRGASKLAGKGTKLRNKLIRKAAESKIKGLRFQSRAGIVLGLGTAISSIFASSAGADIFDDNKSGDEITAFATSAIPFIGALAFRKLAKVRFGGNNPQKTFSNIQRFGQSQSRDIVRKFDKARFKGNKRKKRGDQLDLFGGNS